MMDEDVRERWGKDRGKLIGCGCRRIRRQFALLLRRSCIFSSRDPHVSVPGQGCDSGMLPLYVD